MNALSLMLTRRYHAGGGSLGDQASVELLQRSGRLVGHMLATVVNLFDRGSPDHAGHPVKTPARLSSSAQGMQSSRRGEVVGGGITHAGSVPETPRSSS